MAGQDFDDQLGEAHSPRLRFSIATEDDDSAIRRLLRDNPMRGAISLSLEREPGYFLGTNIGGAQDETILGFRDERLVCIGRCSFRDRWVNGTTRLVGYLGELRLDASVQGRFDILRGGYNFFRSLNRTRTDALYFTSIASDNHRARSFLESGIRGLPRYTFLSDFVTLLLKVPSTSTHSRLLMETASSDHIPAIASILNRGGSRHQLATVWSEENLRSLAHHGLPIEQFQLFMDNNSVIGCCGIWDQRSFRQTVIHGYSTLLSAARPFINLAAHMLKTPRLPAKGTVLNLSFLSPIAIEPESNIALVDLVESLFATAKSRGIEFLTLGLSAMDPQLIELRRRFSPRSYCSRLYQVSWPGDNTGHWNTGSHFLPDVSLL